VIVYVVKLSFGTREEMLNLFVKAVNLLKPSSAVAWFYLARVSNFKKELMTLNLTDKLVTEYFTN